MPSKAVTCPLFYRLLRNEIRVWIPFHSSNGWFDHGLTKRSGKIDTRLTLTTLLFLERSERPGVCGVPSERSGCVPYPGFHPGLVCGAPLGHTERPTSPEPPRLHASNAITATHLVNDDYFFSWATITTPLRDRLPSNPAAAGPGRSEHRNVDTLIPLARQRESPAGPNVPCERRTVPAEPPSRHGSPAPAPALSPSTQPQHSAPAIGHRTSRVQSPSSLHLPFGSI